MNGAVNVIEFDVVWLHSIDHEIAVGRVVAIGFSKLVISQPPRAAVRGPPRALRGLIAVHGRLHAGLATPSAAAVGAACDIDDQVGVSGIIVHVMAQSVVHESPVWRRGSVVAWDGVIM